MKTRDGDGDRWLEISVTLASEYAEPVTHLFSRYGDGRVFVSQTGDWDADDTETDGHADDNVSVFCYLRMDDTLENRKGMIDIGLSLISEISEVDSHVERVVRASEWSNQTFPTIRVARRIVIAPWMPEDDMPEVPDDGDIHIYLTPGLAFGTGNHPTTRLCLNEIEAAGDSLQLTGRRILDVGCGSGVLAIAALKMGAREAWCLDIDDTAIRAVRENLAMSGVSNRAKAFEGTLPHPELENIEFDYVFANITSRVLMDIAHELIAKTKPGGTILASGILLDQLEVVRDAFENRSVATVSETQIEGDWAMLRIDKSATR